MKRVFVNWHLSELQLEFFSSFQPCLKGTTSKISDLNENLAKTEYSDKKVFLIHTVKKNRDKEPAFFQVRLNRVLTYMVTSANLRYISSNIDSYFLQEKIAL